MPTLRERAFPLHASRQSEPLRKLAGAMSLEAGGVRQQAAEVVRQPRPIAAELGEEYGVERFLEGLKAAR